MSTSQLRERWSSRGTTLIELLVGMMISGVLLSVLSSQFVVTAKTYAKMTQLIEAQQGVRAALAEMTQEVRQAGACLPTAGNFISMEGVDDGVHDTLTVRMGLVNEDLTCVITTLSVAASNGSSSITVADASGFEEDDLIYVLRTAASGSFFRITSVSGNALMLDGSLNGSHAVGASVYGVEERTYEIDDSSGTPMLTVAFDGDDPVDLVPGVEALNVTYGLSPCPPCDEVDEPADAAEWRLVRRVTVETKVASTVDDRVASKQTTKIHPRNFMDI